jgi:putative ABC transport system permease protein
MPPRTRTDRLYRWLLRLFPLEFRGDFGADMRADFRDELADARGQGLGAVVRLWWRTVPGMMLAASRAWVDDLVHDTRFALRTMQRSPGFTAAAIVMLALGTGANAAMFSVIDAVLLRSPFADSDRIVELYETSARNGHSTLGIPPSHLDRIATLPAFSSTAAFWGGNAVMRDAGEPVRQSFECITASMFDVLGTRPLLGRAFTTDDDRPGGDAVALISHAMWLRTFGGDQAIVGHHIRLDDTVVTIIGVMPPRFLGPLTRDSTEMWVPLGPTLHGAKAAGCTNIRTLNVFARLRPGLTIADARRQVAASRAIVDLSDTNGITGATLDLVGLDDNRFSDFRDLFIALIGAVACVLLIACVNVANLQLERAASRRHEIALRLALGATRSRIVRQTLTENLLLGSAGAAAGLLAAYWLLPIIASLLPGYVPHIDDITLRPEVLGVTVGVAVAASLAVGVFPSWQATSRAAMDHLRTGARSIAGGGHWPRRIMVVVETALAMTLLVGAGLMIQTFITLRPSHPGFDMSRKTAARIRLEGPLVPTASNRHFFDALRARLRTMPGVARVSGTDYLPMSGSAADQDVIVDDVTRNAWMSRMTDDYLRDVAIPILRGRAFTTGDVAGAEDVAIVNEQAARTFWADGEAVGRTLTVVSSDRKAKTPRVVVGIARNTRSLGGDTRIRPEVYVPYAQDPMPSLYLVVTPSGATGIDLSQTIRQAVSIERPGQVVDRITDLDTMLARSVAGTRFGAWLFGVFGGMAIVLAALGLTATVAWWVTQRTREIGVRLALGASTRQVTHLVLRQGATLAIVGVAIGLGLAALTTKWLADWLYGVKPLDRWTFAVGGLTMIGIALLASYLPARRAARVDPIVTLKAE